MAVISKELFDGVYSNLPCNLMVHPWTPGCAKSGYLTITGSILGSAKFYSIVYLLQILMRAKNMKKKEQWIKMGEYYIRSTCLGFTVTAAGQVLSCIFRNALGRFTYITYLMIPFSLSGVFIYLEPPKRRGLVINLFCNLLIEYYFKVLQRSGYINLNKSKKVLMFMVGSSLLFYLMRLEGDKVERTPLFWIFTPEKVKHISEKSPNVCPHDGDCIKYILKGSLAYFGIGFGISMAKLLLPQIRNPIKAISSIRGKHFKMALFFSSYIGIYRAVICYLCRKRGYDSALYALPAGYMAGLSMVFNPNLGMSIAALTAAFKLYSTILYEKKVLPSRIPLPELLFCLCQGVLLSARILDPDVCPRYVFNLMSTVSGGKCDMVSKSFNEILQRTL